MAEPLVSVVVPSFQQPQYLERCVRSVLEQDHTHLEVVVVDDGSADRSLGLALAIASTDARVRVISRRTNGGLGRARNTGLLAARGEWVTFLDSDDYLLPGALSSRLDVLARLHEWGRDDVVGTYGDWVHVGEMVERPPTVRAPRKGLPVLDRTTYRGDNAIICSSPLVRRSALLEIGGFGEALPMLEDFLAWVRLFAAGGALVPTEHVVCVYRQRQTSMLRGRGLVLPASVRAINDWWQTSAGTPLSASGRLRGWLEGGNPRGFERVHWVFAAGHPSPAPAAVTTASPASSEAYERMREELGRGEADLGSALDDTVEAALRSRVTQLRSDLAPEPDLVLVPTDVEGGLECAALAPRLEALGRRVQIALTSPTALALLPAWCLQHVRVRLLDPPVQRATHVVFGHDDSVSSRLSGALGRDRVLLRPTGIETFRVFRRGAARRFRSQHHLLLRSRLEMAELGDRPASLLPSGARFGLVPGVGAPDEPVVLVPAELVDMPALEGLVSSVLGGLAAAGHEPVLLGDAPVARRLPGLRFGDPRPELLRGTVILPECHEVALLRALCGRPLVLAPGSAPDLTARWAAAHPLHQTVDDVVQQLADEDQLGPDTFTTLVDPALDEDSWVDRFQEALRLAEDRSAQSASASPGASPR